MASSFCRAAYAGLIYAGPSSKEEFDQIPLPVKVHDWHPDKTETLLRADGLEYESRCHSKLLGDYSPNSVTVIFQWFEQRIAATGEVPA